MVGGSWHCTGGRDEDHPQEKEMKESKMVVWGGLTNICAKKRSKKQRRKGAPLGQYEKAKIWCQKMRSSGWKVSDIPLRKSRGQLLISPVGIKHLGQSGNNKCWVVDVSGGGNKVQCCVKNKISEEPGMSGPWIKANWKWSHKRWQEWMSTF